MHNINIKNSQDAIKAYAENTNSGSGAKLGSASIDQLDAFEKVEQVQYDKNSPVSTQAQTVMDNFKEYQKDMQEKAKEEQMEERDDVKQSREDAREIARSLSTEEIRQLRSMGVDVASASLSDIEGLVNSMRADAHKDALANVLAQARIEQGDVSELVFTSTGTQIAGTDTDLKLGNKDILYLLKNRQPLTQETLYKAHYSGQRDFAGPGESCENPADPASGMQEQLAHVIAQAGIPVDETSMAGANLLLANDIPVTTDSMRAYMELQAQIGKDITELPTMQQEASAQTEALLAKASKLQQDVARLTAEDITQAVRANRPLTIASLVAAMESRTQPGVADVRPDAELMQAAGHVPADAAQTQADLRTLTARRQLEEIRLSMTQSVAVRMLKSDINIDTRELTQVVAKLKNAEEQLTRELFAKQGVASTEENRSIYQQVRQDLRVIGEAPAVRLGRLLDADIAEHMEGASESYAGQTMTTASGAMRVVTVHGLAELVSAEPDGTYLRTQAGQTAAPESIRRSADFAAMEREYEALGTAPRADMGDSIRKAFSNVEDILRDMELPVDAEHVRAVRILGYNQLALSDENIARIIEYDRAVNDMLTACQPHVVLSLIKDGINPLAMSVDELNQVLREKNYKPGVKETDDFAAYLRDMEKQGKVSADERAGYIGLYRVFRQLEKSGDREAGYLFANNSRLTIRNLITAMRSRKAAGMEVAVDDSFGLLSDLQTRGTKMDAQIGQAFAQAGQEGGTDQSGIQAGQESGTDQAGVREDIENPWTALDDMPERELAQAEQLLVTHAIEESAQNLKAAGYILHDFYTFASQAWKQFGWQDHTKEDAVDAETDAMAKSLAGEEIALPFEAEQLWEQLEAGMDLSQTYAHIQQQMVEQMYTQAEESEVTSEQLAGLKVVQAGFRILGAMAKQRQYQLPLATDKGTKLVNLTLQMGTHDARGITIRMPSENYGMLQAALTMQPDGTVTGAVLAEDAAGNTQLAGQTERFRGLLAGSDYAGAAISLGETRMAGDAAAWDEPRMKEVYMNGQADAPAATDTQKLCAAAVFFVKALAELSDI